MSGDAENTPVETIKKDGSNVQLTDDVPQSGTDNPMIGDLGSSFSSRERSATREISVDEELRDSVVSFGTVVKCERGTMEVEVTNHYEEKLRLFERPKPRQEWTVNPALSENPNAPQYINTMSLDSEQQHRTSLPFN